LVIMATEVVTLRGSFAALELTAVVREVVLHSATAKIEISQRTAQRQLWLCDGRIQGVTSKIEHERLGSWLASRALITRKVMREILVNKPRAERLGTVLLERRLIDRERLQKELEDLALTVAGRMLLLDGEYEAEPQVRLPGDAVSLNFVPAELFVYAARRVPDTGNFEVLAGGARQWSVADHGAVAEQAFELLPMESWVLGQLAVPQTLDELRALAPNQEHEVNRAIVALASGGFVAYGDSSVKPATVERVVAAAPPKPPPPPAPVMFDPGPPATAVPPVVAAPPVAAAPPKPPPPPAPAMFDPAPLATAVPPVVAAPPVAAAPPSSQPSCQSWRPPVRPAWADEDLEGPIGPFPAANPKLRAFLTRVEGATNEGDGDDPDGGEPSLLEARRAQLLKSRAAELLAHDAKSREACRCLAQAMEIAPDPDGLVRLAALEMESPVGKPRALEHLKHAVTLAPSSTAAWMALAGYWSERGNQSKQRRCLEKILAYEADNEAARRALAAIKAD
jgi:hypothetical protein